MNFSSSESVKSQLVSLPEDQSLLLADVYEDFCRRREQGENPSIEEYAQQYPDIASVIRDVIPALGAFVNVHPSGSGVRPMQALPSHVAGCQIVREIGQGAMGVVYEAVHPSLSRRLAIKVLRPLRGDPSRMRERFLREAEAASRLNHPNIVPFVDFGNDGDNAYLSMLFIDGLSLDHVLRNILPEEGESITSHSGGQSILPPSDASCETAVEYCRDFRNLAGLGADVAAAMSHAHSHRIVHRDIKPANLILDSDGKIWVTDFGLAKIHNDDDNLSRTGDLIGTPRYMAPEQIRGICSTHSDIYALGVTLYELASGRKAWEAVPRSELLTARASLDLPDLQETAPSVPAGLARIIMKACAFRPEDRYETAAEMEHVLRRFAEGHTEGDRRKRERIEGESYVRRKPVLLGAATAVLSTVLVIALSTVTSRNTLKSPETAGELLAVIENEDFTESVVENLPDRPDEDTQEDQESREEFAARADNAIERTINNLVADKEDQEVLKETFREVTDTYRAGAISKDDARQSLDSIRDASSTIVMAIRIRNAGRQLLQSSLSESEKKYSIAVLGELSQAMSFGKLGTTAFTKLKADLPPKSNSVSRSVLDAALRRFVSRCLASVNSIHGMPTGAPGSEPRLMFLQKPNDRISRQTAE